MTAPGRRFNDVVTRFWSVAAPVYDLPALQRWFYRPVQDEVVAQLRAHQSRRVADIACGTGILATRIHNELDTDEVYGVDMSDGMLAQARARCGRVRWLKAPAERLPFDDGALDAVVSTTAFHFFDQPVAMREFHRVLAPGGLVAVGTISPPDLPVLRLLRLGPNGTAHTPTPAEVLTLFTEAGFHVVDQHRTHRPAWSRPVFDLITVGKKD
ncbi:MAG: methyltransferase domain-containing protein [Mycobacterium sp.]|nr:methyltransferase domain-containing protein [Mycobacterium sp.]